MRIVRPLFALAAASAVVLLAVPPAGGISFSDVTKASGIRHDFFNDLRRGRMIATMGGGVAMGDYDGDGFPDLFFTGTVANGKKPDAGPCGVLFRNRGDGTFEDATAKAGIRSCGWKMGASWVDVDSDGRLDLIVTGVGKTEIWKNLGNGAFREVSAERGLVAPLFAVGLAAGDADGDGRVDLYVVNYLDTDYENERKFGAFEVRLPEDYEGQEAFLFVQRPDGRFEERTREAAVTNHGGKGLVGVFFDYDGDGRQDLFISNDRVPNVLYRNATEPGGPPRFTDVTVETGAGARDMKQARAGMGMAVGDVDGDGHPDVLVTNFAGEPVTFYRNVEGQLFDDGAAAAGLERASLPHVQWGADFVDLDNDGWPDLAVVSGHLVPRLLNSIGNFFRKGGLGYYQLGNRSYRQPPVLWKNAGSGRFGDVTADSGDFAKLRLAARGLAVGDVDGDGLPDLAIAAVSGGVRLMRNTTRGAGHALDLLPVAGADHRTVLGTKVIVTSGGRRQVQEFILRPSYASGSWVPLHFGLGPAAAAERVEVIPPGETQPRFVLTNVAADRLWELRDGQLNVRREFRR